MKYKFLNRDLEVKYLCKVYGVKYSGVEISGVEYLKIVTRIESVDIPDFIIIDIDEE